jgi:hypothetical protein
MLRGFRDDPSYNEDRASSRLVSGTQMPPTDTHESHAKKESSIVLIDAPQVPQAEKYVVARQVNVLPE